MMKKILLVSLCLAFLGSLAGQSCQLTLSGKVWDKGTGIPLEYANVYIEENQQGASTDSTGYFQIKNLCPGPYHIRVTHVGCEPEQTYLTLSRDTMLNFNLAHHAELLEEVHVHGSAEETSPEISSSIKRDEITGQGNKNLSDILETISGVNTLRTGSGISKPIIHGLYGNRINILNNGIVQAGQKWGNDHAPEIDPFIADHLSVIKGAGALAYGSGALGGVVLVETDNISEDPHLHGEVNYLFQSNGLGHTVNSSMEKGGAWAKWRVTGTLKMQGNQRAPDYYLTNTGKREANLALQMQKQVSDTWHTDLYYSLFNTEIGILRGSHIGNVTDLNMAISRDEPFFTQDDFSYEINAPRQTVMHHLLKVESKHFLSDQRVVKFKYGGQFNRRKEFDVRRSGRSDIPALSLDHLSHFFEAVYNGAYESGIFVKSGLQFTSTDNDNNPETGILPLIPNYYSLKPAAFLIFRKEVDETLYEFGARYEYENLQVKKISNSLPRIVEEIEHHFHNYSITGGFKAEVTPEFQTNVTLAYKVRSPAVNELYSFGLHQGVSGIEEGDPDLVAENSFKATLSGKLQVGENLFFHPVVYFQFIDDYIFLEPQDEFRLTIRGAFPVFSYQQTNARLAGTDLLLKYEPNAQFKFVGKYEMVRGTDVLTNMPLVFMPPDRLSGTATYFIPDGKKRKNTYIELTGSYSFEQTRLEPEQDFLPPPEGYFLLGGQIGTTFPVKEQELKVDVSVENALNTSYRDYLNRLRYFADELGVNVRIGLRYRF